MLRRQREVAYDETLWPGGPHCVTEHGGRHRRGKRLSKGERRLYVLPKLGAREGFSTQKLLNLEVLHTCA